ncbi:hypothetical protein ABIA96_001445 [Bradyrhizobium sp. LB11.1]
MRRILAHNDLQSLTVVGRLRDGRGDNSAGASH